MSADPLFKARARARWSLRLAGVNAAIVAIATGWYVVVGWALSGSGNPPGPQFAFAALVLPVLFLAGVLFLAVAAAGASLAIAGWAAGRRSPGHPSATLNAAALGLHLAPPVLLVAGRQVWLTVGG